MGWNFRARERLASVSNARGRDVNVGNSHVLDRIEFGLLGKLARKDQVWIWIGVARLALRRMAMIRS